MNVELWRFVWRQLTSQPQESYGGKCNQHLPDQNVRESRRLTPVGRSLALFVHLSTFSTINSGVAYSSMPHDGLPAYGTTAPLDLSKLRSFVACVCHSSSKISKRCRRYRASSKGSSSASQRSLLMRCQPRNLSYTSNQRRWRDLLRKTAT